MDSKDKYILNVVEKLGQELSGNNVTIIEYIKLDDDKLKIVFELEFHKIFFERVYSIGNIDKINIHEQAKDIIKKLKNDKPKGNISSDVDW